MCRNSKLNLWRRHLNWFIPFVSEFYPLTRFQLLQYEELLDWSRIKLNPFIRWDEEALITFQDRLSSVEKFVHLPLEIYYGKSAIPTYPSADEIYLRANEYGEGKIFWKDIKFGVGDIGEAGEDDVAMKLIWHFECGDKLSWMLFKDRPLDNNYLEKITEPKYWQLLSRYFGLDWSFVLLEKYENFWDTEQLICNQTVFNYCLKDDLDDEFIEGVLN